MGRDAYGLKYLSVFLRFTVKDLTGEFFQLKGLVHSLKDQCEHVEPDVRVQFEDFLKVEALLYLSVVFSIYLFNNQLFYYVECSYKIKCDREILKFKRNKSRVWNTNVSRHILASTSRITITTLSLI